MKISSEKFKRAGGVALRFLALAASFALIRFVSPVAESALAAIDTDRLASSLVRSELGISVRESSFDLRRLALDVPFAVTSAPEPEISDAAPEPAAEALPAPVPETGLFYIPDEPAPSVPETDAVATTITGEKSSLYCSGSGLFYNNKTGYDIDVEKYLAADTGLSADNIKVLIIHTHGSESYAQTADDAYVESDHSRTTDKTHNVTRVGDALADVLTARGVAVIHDTELYDYPDYNGSYTRSYDAIKKYLAAHPDIGVVIDLHRDALEADDGTVYKTVAQIEGETCSQVMLISGTNFSGLDHPNWEKNLTFAFHLQKRMSDAYPSLARPLKISQYRYNQQATTGSLIVEVGCNGNTLAEAVRAAEHFGDCLAAELGK